MNDLEALFVECEMPILDYLMILLEVESGLNYYRPSVW